MDLLMALEGMAQVVDDVERWQKLFDFTYEEALQALTKHRENNRILSVSQDEWEAVEEVQKALGHDKESFEYSKNRKKIMIGSAKKSVDRNSMWLLKLEGPLADAGKVKVTGGLHVMPRIFSGTGSGGGAENFCLVDGETKRRIMDHFGREIDCGEFAPTFIRDHRAKKELSAHSKYPTLGIDSTMPQHRPSAPGVTIVPSQDQYPVWYFLYGTLSDSKFLAKLLGLQECPRYHAAHVRGGRLTSWGGKYKALVNSAEEHKVEGEGYQVLCEEDEQNLRIFETDKYEVVRVTIIMEDGFGTEEVPGLTFRFIEEI